MNLRKKFRKLLKKKESSPLELNKVLTLYRKKGILSQGEYLLFERILEAGKTPVGEIIIPRVDMVCINERSTLKEATELYRKEGYSKIPLIRERKDEIIGVLHIKEILKNEDMNKLVRDICQEPVFIPEYKKVLDTLWFMQKKHISIAIVIDEFGSVIGLVTMEDLLEEIVGELVDELDREEVLYQILDDNTYLFSARIELEEVSELLGIDLKSQAVHTLGGYVVSSLQRVPVPGEKIQLDGVEFEVIEGTPQRVKVIKVKMLPT